MSAHVIFLSIPGLREKDLARMPRLSELAQQGEVKPLTPSFPAVTLSVQANLTTGELPAQHGVVANGYYWRDTGEVEMWTAWNDKVLRPQLWDRLHQQNPELTSAVWFPMFSKGCGADYVCVPAPIHNPDGGESLWCYSKPDGLYQDLRERLGHFPLQHFWGPLANIQSSAWIVASAIEAARRWRPNLFYIYLPHLDYAAQKQGPDSWESHQACEQLDGEIGKLIDGLAAAYGDQELLWLAATEYVITPVHHVAYPNRLLRAAGLLKVTHDEDGKELIDFTNTPAWALCDHQHAHVFVNEHADINQVIAALEGQQGIARVLTRDDQAEIGLDHARSGDLVTVSQPESWQAYYWWEDDERAPAFARTVDIHNKPGFDPVEMHFDPATRGIPLDATLVRGSHGAPADSPQQRGLLLASRPGVIVAQAYRDIDVAKVVLKQFGP
ncbi:Type I phosphodiesterase / nucleotide pyrophosphatase [Pirellulimonas nuda]|uniref:Type I phosphodiesterase / nucleotide pyrophosphatase n=1 Tax=Pirellulimonas nuda TaxID=2528009 RepID=A0A518DB42_9BACT|nr:nucleotide pyrophosphatase/phosphodiesterase family protein [Pirellulimonas nuda]QDU88646.1 Type I phosphodiesterase / nucleotide pyrophosphatase [Pirellulimonas nuda]